MRSLLLALAMSVPGVSSAADAAGPHLVVEGRGTVSRAPDLATIRFTARGEGKTSDEAVKAMVAMREQAGQAARAVAPDSDLKDENMQVVAIHDAACKIDDDNPRLNSGACAIIGYVATLPITLRTHMAQAAGTVTGVIARQTGTEPRIVGYSLANPAALELLALGAAMADARRQADDMARAGQVRLGRVLSISNTQYGGNREDEIVVTGAKQLAPSPVMAPPVEVSITPAPVETTARVVVSYEITG